MGLSQLDDNEWKYLSSGRAGVVWGGRVASTGSCRGGRCLRPRWGLWRIQLWFWLPRWVVPLVERQQSFLLYSLEGCMVLCNASCVVGGMHMTRLCGIVDPSVGHSGLLRRCLLTFQLTYPLSDTHCWWWSVDEMVNSSKLISVLFVNLNGQKRSKS